MPSNLFIVFYYKIEKPNVRNYSIDSYRLNFFRIFFSVQTERLSKKMQTSKRIRKPKTCQICGKVLKAGAYSLNRHVVAVHRGVYIKMKADNSHGQNVCKKKGLVDKEEANITKSKWKTKLIEKYNTIL